MSSHAAQFRALAAYNTWMNERLYAAAADLSDADRKRDLGAFFGSVHGTFNHLLVADRFLLGRIRTVHTSSQVLAAAALLDDFEPARELFADFTELRRERRVTDRVIEAWSGEIGAAVLEQPLPNGRPTWLMLGHFFNHQTHHRGQVTTLLKQLGRDPGVTDLSALPWPPA